MAHTKLTPFTQGEVDSLNAYQQSGAMHPFTCGSGKHTDFNHLDGEGVLMARPEGLYCPYCNYVQNWCWPWMADWSWRDLFGQAAQ